MQIHIDADSRCAITSKAQHLPLARGIRRIQPFAQQHLLTVKRPSLGEDRIFVMSANLVGQMIGDRDLKEMAGDAFVAEERAGVLDCRANVKVAALRIVGRDEVEAAVVRIINAGWIHKPAGTGRLERFGKLANQKRSDVFGNRDQPLLF